MGTNIFDLVTLTMEFVLHFDNFKLANNFRTMNARALIFPQSILCDKTFSWVLMILILWPWPWILTYFLKL